MHKKSLAFKAELADPNQKIRQSILGKFKYGYYATDFKQNTGRDKGRDKVYAET
jgi:hypothetical protein